MSTKFQDWIGRQESEFDTIAAAPMAGLSATLDRKDEKPQKGTVLPPLWHWVYFVQMARLSCIGADGHRKRGEFLPPVSQPRRMWAGGEFEFSQPLHVGDHVERRSTIENISEKTGRTGSLVFVQLKHDFFINNDQIPAMVEKHDIVYQQAPQVDQPAPPPTIAPTGHQWEKRIEPTEVLLFRYSALTCNGHRIHYDRTYATEVEGYPGLIVHGPLIATMLLDALHQELGQKDLHRFRFRAIRPTFDTNPFYVCGLAAEHSKAVRLWAKDHQGYLTVEASAEWH